MSKSPPEPRSVDSPPQGERLQRVIANHGIASRRAAETMITAGRVTVNGKVVTVLGTRVDPRKDRIHVDGKPLPRQKPRFIMLNKPAGFITTVKDERDRWTVMDLVNVQERVYPVGRLDRETQGLILLTNVGDVANRVMHPRYGLVKEYHVLTLKRPNDRQLERLREGIEIEDRLIVPDEVRLLRETREGIAIRVVLHEGLFHVVRRMMDAVGIDVERLRRVRMGPVSIQGVPTGAWRDLTPGELVSLYEAVGLDRAEADRINAQRPMQLEPVGGYHHQNTGTRQPPSQAPGGPGSAPPRSSPSGPPAPRGGGGKPPGGPRQARRIQRQSGSRSGTGYGRRFDGPRPSQGHRDRRTGGGR